MITEIDYGTSVHYRLKNELHRPNGPAIIWSDGSWVWLFNGDYHRYYGPQCNDENWWWIHDVRIK